MNPQLIQLMLSGLVTVVDLIVKLRAEAVRTNVMTPEQDKEFDQKLQELFKEPHWQRSDRNG